MNRNKLAIFHWILSAFNEGQKRASANKDEEVSSGYRHATVLQQNFTHPGQARPGHQSTVQWMTSIIFSACQIKIDGGLENESATTVVVQINGSSY